MERNVEAMSDLKQPDEREAVPSVTTSGTHPHAVNHDEQQASQDDRCIVCGVERHVHHSKPDLNERIAHVQANIYLYSRESLAVLLTEAQAEIARLNREGEILDGFIETRDNELSALQAELVEWNGAREHMRVLQARLDAAEVALKSCSYEKARDYFRTYFKVKS